VFCQSVRPTVTASRRGRCPRVLRMSFREWSSKIARQAAAVGSLPADTPDEQLRKSALVLSSLLITILSFVWVGTYAALGPWRSAAIPLAYQVVSMVGLAFLARTKRYAAYRASQVAMFLVLPFLLQWSPRRIRGVGRGRALGVRCASRRARLTPGSQRHGPTTRRRPPAWRSQ
jgi:hypothetical protein